MLKLIILILFFTFSHVLAWTQKLDINLNPLQKIPIRNIDTIEKKLTKFTYLDTYKTEGTLTKLSRWETKMKTMSERTSPQTAQRLFGNNQHYCYSWRSIGLTLSGDLQ